MARTRLTKAIEAIRSAPNHDSLSSEALDALRLAEALPDAQPEAYTLPIDELAGFDTVRSRSAALWEPTA